MGVGEWRWGHLAFVSFQPDDALLGDALSWRRPAGRRLLLVTLPLGDACAWRHPTWATHYVDSGLDADFDLDFVNARVWDDTKFSTDRVALPHSYLLTSRFVVRRQHY